MRKIKLLLWDIDGTLLDFIAAEKVAIRACFDKFGLGECTDEMIGRYSVINRRYWEALERGEISKQEVLVGRYREFFQTEGLDVSKAEAVNAEYQIRLGDTCVFRDDGYNLVKELKGEFLQFAVTNGTSEAQTRKLKNSGLGELFDDVFISDQIGHEKPTVDFFAPIFEKVDYAKDEILIIGDSLTSDIRGGNNIGIKTCWYNPDGNENNHGVYVDYEIDDLQKLRQIIK